MALDWLALGAPIASLAGSALGFIGSQQNNAASLNFARQQQNMANSQFQQNLLAQYHALDRTEQWQRESQDWQSAMAREMFDKSTALQREFAQSGIKWRVDDARAAGVHPLFALGGGGAGFSSPSISLGGGAPSASMGAAPGGGGSYSPIDSGQYLSRMGQDLGRAIAAAQSKEERGQDLLRSLAIQRADLENQLLASQLAKSRASTQVGPGMPSSTSPVGGPLGVHEVDPNKVLTSYPGGGRADQHAAGRATPSIQWSRHGDGLVSAPTKPVGAEDEFGAPMMMEWWIRNRIAPYVGYGEVAPPMDMVRSHFPGAVGVRFDRGSFKWVPVYSGERPPARGYGSNVSGGVEGVMP